MSQRQRLRALVPEGFEAVRVRRGHLLIRDVATQEPLRLPDGRPLHVAATPSDHRADSNARAAIRRAVALARLDGEAVERAERQRLWAEGRKTA